MEKNGFSCPATFPLASSLQNLNLNTGSSLEKALYQHSTASNAKTNHRSLVSLCLGVLGKHFEDIIDNLSVIMDSFPPDIKMAMMAIARRRKLLNDDVLISLADSSWEVLDISGSDVSDFGLTIVAEMFESLRAVDISRCREISAVGVSELLNNCRSLETLRCGGCQRSGTAMRRCLGILKPKFVNVTRESWEELDSKEIAKGAVSLRWLLWPNIDGNSWLSLAADSPRIVLNPNPSPFSFRGVQVQVPTEAIADIALDDPFVKDIDPKTWAVSGFVPRVVPLPVSSPTELPKAERFRLAFVERDERLAPKRAKNVRQHRRRAERELVMSSTEAKAVALASRQGKLLQGRT
ncbi:hypothetical protein IFM89_024602 [Coptis chinensis]|uniref:RNI-like superfamily protein n=1 Tax=Coptis chinensis TaxID=261450 RepID=A0A835I507_9MAGN|nr:hypothetical protein IFM89_024602 [Coptis chinensis]